MNVVSVDLGQLLRLHNECGDGVALLEMLIDRVDHDSPCAWRAHLRRRGRDILPHVHQHIAVLDAWMQEVQLDGQGIPLPETYLPQPGCKLIAEAFKEIIEVDALLGLLTTPVSDICRLCICHLLIIEHLKCILPMELNEVIVLMR